MLDKLSPRERMMIMGVFVLGLLVVFVMAGKKVSDMRGRKRSDVVTYRTQLAQIMKVRDIIRTLPPAPRILTASEYVAQLSALAKQQNLQMNDIRDRTENGRRYTRVYVQMTFNSAPLKQVMQLIHEVEYNKRLHMSVSSLVFRRSLPTKEVYDVNLAFVAQHPRKATRRRGRR